MFYSPSNDFRHFSTVSVKQANAKQMDLLDASSSMFMVGLKATLVVVDCGSDYTLQSLGSARLKVERDMSLIWISQLEETSSDGSE